MLKSLSSRKIPSLFGKEERRGRPSKSEGNVGKSKAEPQSIVGKYRKEFGSLKAGENQRMYDSVTKCIVVAEGAEQQKREHHLKLKRSWIQSDTTMNNMEVFFRCAMPNSGFSRMLNAMEEKLSNAAIGDFVKVEAITPEELRAYLQYITNPTDMKMEALSSIAGKDVFGRGNGHMSIIPVVTVVKEMHSAGGIADQCPLTSPEINIWLKDSSAKYEVKKRAPKFDFAEALPLMYDTNFSDSNECCYLEKLRNWTCILVMVSYTPL